MNPPNKPCECGSGIKQKKCHPFGAPLIGCQTYAEYKEEKRQEYFKTPAGQLVLKEKRGKFIELQVMLATFMAAPMVRR